MIRRDTMSAYHSHCSRFRRDKPRLRARAVNRRACVITRVRAQIRTNIAYTIVCMCTGTESAGATVRAAWTKVVVAPAGRRRIRRRLRNRRYYWSLVDSLLRRTWTEPHSHYSRFRMDKRCKRNARHRIRRRSSADGVRARGSSIVVVGGAALGGAVTSAHDIEFSSAAG